MQYLTRIPIFIAVVEEQSFTGAAEKLGITGSAVSKQVRTLENELQIKLLNRSTRHVSLTDEGAVYFNHAKLAIEELNGAREEITEMKTTLRGPLRVSLPQGLATKYLSKHIANFASKFPEISLDISLEDRFIDPVADGFDLIIRIGTLEDSSLISRKLANSPFAVCASPKYIENAGVPDTPKDLAAHNVLLYTRNSGNFEWRFKDPQNEIGRVNISGLFKADSGDMLCDAALKGVGIAILPIFYVADHLQSGKLIQLLPHYHTWPERDIHAIFRSKQFQSARLRAFLEHLIIACQNLPWK
jgi:DNA-binding transcriptional LysR family regulator